MHVLNRFSFPVPTLLNKKKHNKWTQSYIKTNEEAVFCCAMLCCAGFCSIAISMRCVHDTRSIFQSSHIADSSACFSYYGSSVVNWPTRLFVSHFYSVLVRASTEKLSFIFSYHSIPVIFHFISSVCFTKSTVLF